MLVILSHDEAAAEQLFRIVKNDRLSRRHRTLRLFKNRFDFIAFDMQHCFGRRCRIAYFCQNFFAVIRSRITIRENIVCGRNLTSEEIFIVTKHDLVLRGANLRHKRGFSERDAETFTLTNRIMQDPQNCRARKYSLQL